jgi:hypothetical protein
MVTADDDPDHPGPYGADLHQRDEGGGGQQLVGDRIEQDAESGDLVAAPGQPAVEPVGQGCQQEDENSYHLPRQADMLQARDPGHEDDHQDRRQEDADDRNPGWKVDHPISCWRTVRRVECAGVAALG